MLAQLRMAALANNCCFGGGSSRSDLPPSESRVHRWGGWAGRAAADVDQVGEGVEE
jgi:hypothetical protein